MTFKKIVSTFIALCLMATSLVAMSGCDDLGVYEDTMDYYGSFGKVVLINGTSGDVDEHSVKEKFYNKESRENFCEAENSEYDCVDHGDYVYMAIPLASNINIDSIALYLQSQTDVSVYISIFVTDYVPTAWRSIADNLITGGDADSSSGEEIGSETAPPEQTEETGTPDDTGALEETGAPDDTGQTEEKKTYDDPDPDSSVGDIVVHLKDGKWNSFLLENFLVDETKQESIEIQKGQYILLQIRNNSGVRDYDEDKHIFVDKVTGLELQKAEITMTNLLIRALNIENDDDIQGGE